MAETVNLNEDGRRATITGRKRASLQQKMNPMWWFMNSAEQTVNEAPWYRPALPYWQRWLYWSIRNPLQNLRAFVLGVARRCIAGEPRTRTASVTCNAAVTCNGSAI